ncbi:unnamed protein product [Nippostrongylus brasiliensis]|uniref:Homeobox domain-containing protein n=1 Tax=Nippostrongylus brasiliensis TaxID=27835 RepID=A0A0N4YUD0_NIPBR|nr:unnamed protein product [Nippostrongylus brasiliensis]
MAWLQPEPMEPIPEEGTEDAAEWTLSPTSLSARKTRRKREIFTSEQVDTLVRLATDDPTSVLCVVNCCSGVLEVGRLTPFFGLIA